MFKGSIVALVTPFTETGEVDYLSLKNLVDWYVSLDVDGIVCCGTTGEAPTLSYEEKISVFKTVIDVAHGKIPVIAGTGTYDTRKTVRMTLAAKDLGADGCLVIVPYYSRPTPEGCIAHYREVGKVGLPTIVYHHPGRTGIRLSAETLAEIGKIPSIVAIKEATGTINLTQEIRRLSSIPILSGDDSNAYDLMLEGAVGVISIVANVIPDEWKRFVHAFLEGDYNQAKQLNDCYSPLYQAMVLETNPQCVKYALNLLGKCGPYYRLPLLEPRLDTKQQIQDALTHLKLYKREELVYDNL